LAATHNKDVSFIHSFIYLSFGIMALNPYVNVKT